ncbi:MAG TPA: sigma-70 family RNA polymerase sigma factor [Gaiellaceae bacterium]|nr:sigma-70 family RNA polymerase sigma factor [Gaiellaceae bacterium]
MEPNRSGNEWLAERFEQHRGDLTAVAYRLLGSRTEADDAVQEAWLRLSRVEADEIENLVAWLTTVVARIALNMLQARPRRDETLDTVAPPAIAAPADDSDPEREALLADSVGVALLVVLETLTPAERLAFVLHDMFALSFDEIATILERSPDAARQLASRARRRVRGVAPPADSDPTAERAVVEAFLAAARDGDFDALLELLDPNVVLRHAAGPGRVSEHQGAEIVLQRAVAFSRLGLTPRRARINGVAGWVGLRNGQLFSASAITVRGGRITAMTFITDRGQLEELEISFLS